MRLLLLALCCFDLAFSLQIDFLTDFGAIPDDDSPETCDFNSKLLSRVLTENASGSVLTIPQGRIFHLHHGVYAENVTNSVIKIDGTLRFEKSDIDKSRKLVPACLNITFSRNITITSNDRGLIDGRGPHWWGVPMIGYVQNHEKRPRLFTIYRSSDVLIERIILQDSPYHTLYLKSVENVEVRNISIVARRTESDGHGWVDLSAFNTDGIDVSGNNIHVHDIDIWVQDDCIAVKDNPFGDYRSTNMTFERINATGMGFVVGSILGSTVHNITFRDSYLHRPIKGIYLKFAKQNVFWRSTNRTARVERISYENITIEGPTQWPIWIGPAQQADNENPCHANPCSLCWPMSPTAKCHIVDKSKYVDIRLVDVNINNPKISPGVIMARGDNQIEGLSFHNVRVSRGREIPVARLPRTETFPGLLQPIHDPFVPSTDGDESRVTAIHRSLNGEEDGFPQKFRPFHKPKWERWNRYYHCEGVMNGTVSGNTWPVPSCFSKIDDPTGPLHILLWLSLAVFAVLCSVILYNFGGLRSV